MLGRKLGIMAFIYVIRNHINGKQYVGKTNSTIEKRFQEHIRDSKRRRCEKRPLYNAMNKYGVEYFSIERLEECTSEEAPEREKYWIEKLGTYKHGYNATCGGDGKQIYNYKEIAAKYKELQSQKETATFFHCDIFTVHQACIEEDVSLLSSSEATQKRCKKKIAMYDKDSNQLIKTFSSVKEAAHFLGNIASPCHIGQVALGKRKTAYGYKWKYI